VALNGELGDLSLPDLFYVIQMRRLSGRLALQHDHDDIMLFFQRGKLIYVTSSHNSNKLGQLAVQAGKLTIAQLGQALATQAMDDAHPPLGQILVARDWLTPEDLNELLIKQSEAILYQALAWSRAAFSFTSEATAPLQMPLRALNVEQIILEATRRADEQAAGNAGTLGLNSSVLLIDDPNVLRITATLQLQARIVIASIREGAATLHQVVETTGLSQPEVLQIVRELIGAGILLISTPSEMSAAPRHGRPTSQRAGLLAPRHATPRRDDPYQRTGRQVREHR